ncbi:MAG: hypothetical protein K0Q79_323 [Flavipsychrobacter sp.]|jgi:hypothetical protein|nr:hypothetical protein [Flavipsychrobacter sp.]
MKKILLTLVAGACLMAGCRKEQGPPPQLGIYGLEELTLYNTGFFVGSLPITVRYDDTINAPQETVALEVSGLPPNVSMDTAWQHSGQTPLHTRILLYDTAADRVMPGSYPIVITMHGSRSGTQTFTFMLKVVTPTPCTGNVVGQFNFCFSYNTFVSYKDSVYDDPTIPQKVWFTNFHGTGKQVYALFNCYTHYLEIPPQVVGGHSYWGGNICKNKKDLSLTIHKDSEVFTVTMH